MSAAVSTRTLVRDAVIRILTSRKKDAQVRVAEFAVSPRFLSEQETNQKHTYCVIITDEQVDTASSSQRARGFAITVKIVCYAYDQADPHAVLDAMIEDAAAAMGLLVTQPELRGLVWHVVPESITTDEGTTAALPWGQAVCQWSARHARA
jgi:hypothetical protein